MENPPPAPNEPKQICSINIAFPVESDEQAIEMKRKVELALAEVSDARFDFRIMKMGSPRV